MKRESVEVLLRRARLRDIPGEQLAGYTAAVRRRLSTQPTMTVMPAHSVFAWWRIGVPLGMMAVVLAMVLVRPMHHQHQSARRAEEASLVEEAAILTTVAPEESLLPEDDVNVLDEMEWLDQDLPHEIEI